MVFIVAVIVLLVALAFGLFIFWLQRRSQEVAPRVSDDHAAGQDNVVAFDDQDRPVRESVEEPEEAPRDMSAFEAVLREEETERQKGGPES